MPPVLVITRRVRGAGPSAAAGASSCAMRVASTLFRLFRVTRRPTRWGGSSASARRTGRHRPRPRPRRARPHPARRHRWTGRNQEWRRVEARRLRQDFDPARQHGGQTQREEKEEGSRDTGLLSAEVVVARLNRLLTGRANYFNLGQVSPAYRAVDQHATRRLRQWLCRRRAGYPEGERDGRAEYVAWTLKPGIRTGGVLTAIPATTARTLDAERGWRRSPASGWTREGARAWAARLIPASRVDSSGRRSPRRSSARCLSAGFDRDEHGSRREANRGASPDPPVIAEREAELVCYSAARESRPG